MIRTLLALLALACAASAQITTIQGSDTLSSSRSVINSNFSYLDTNKQAVDAELTCLAGLTSAADRLAYFTGSGTCALLTFPSWARTFVSAANQSAGIAALGLTLSGNTTEVATVSGAKTAGKQATFDADGNLIVSAYDVGAAGSSFTVASQAEAEEGTNNTNGMTPLRTKQAIDYQIASYLTGYVDPAANTTWSGQQYYPATATQTLDAAGDTISPNGPVVAISCDSALTLTSTPTIADGTNGQLLTIRNVGGTHACTLTSGSSYNLRLTASTVAIPAYGQLSLAFDSTVGDWVQDGVASGTSSSITSKSKIGTTSTPGSTSNELLGTITITGVVTGGYIQFGARYIHDVGTSAIPVTELEISNGSTTVSYGGAWAGATHLTAWHRGEIAITASNELTVSTTFLSNTVAGSTWSQANTLSRSKVETLDVSGGTITINFYGRMGAATGSESVTLKHYYARYYPQAD